MMKNQEVLDLLSISTKASKTLILICEESKNYKVIISLMSKLVPHKIKMRES